MAFCQKCGNEVMDEAVVCTKCGCATGLKAKRVKTQSLTEHNIVSLFFAILAVLGLIIYVLVINYPDVPFIVGLSSVMEASVFAWLSIGFCINNAFTKKFDVIFDTIGVSISSIVIITNVVIIVTKWSSILASI